METLDFSNVLPSFNHEVILTAAKNTRPHIGILDFRLDFKGCLFESVDVAYKVVIEDEFSGISIVLVLVFWNYAALLVNLDVFTVDVEGREAPLVALLLLSIVLRTDNLLNILLKSLIENHFQSCKRVLILVENNAVSTGIALDLLLRVGFLRH